jgi:hypothetical protein
MWSNVRPANLHDRVSEAVFDILEWPTVSLYYRFADCSSPSLPQRNHDRLGYWHNTPPFVVGGLFGMIEVDDPMLQVDPIPSQIQDRSLPRTRAPSNQYEQPSMPGHVDF